MVPGLEAVCARCAGQHSSTALRLYGTPHTCTTPLGCPPWCLVLLQFKAEKAERAGGSAVTAAEGGETSTFHGKALHDYQGAAVCGCGVWCAAAVSPPPQRPQSRNLTSCTPLLLLLPAGRSWLEAPRDATQRQVDQCFLPKRHVHTWSGHSKGVNAIRCAAAAPGATAWHCSLGAQIAAFGSAATLRFPALTTDLSSPRPRRLQLLPLHRSPAAVCGVGWPDQDVGCGGRQEVHAHLHGAHQGGRGGGGFEGSGSGGFHSRKPCCCGFPPSPCADFVIHCPSAADSPLQGVKDIWFSNDGRRFVSTGYDKQIRYWDTETGKVIK